MVKLSISKAWEDARAILARDGGLLATIALALMVLPGVVSDMVTPSAQPGELPEPGAWIAVAVVALLIGLVGQLALIRLAIRPNTSVGEAIRHGFARAPAYVLATLIWVFPFAAVAGLLISRMSGEAPSPGVALGLLVLVPVFLFLFVRLILTSSVASAERLGPVAILKRSWELTRGSWWRLFGFFLLFLVAALVVMMVVASIAGLIATLVFGDLKPFSVGALLVSLLSQLAAAAVTVVFVIMLARIYVQVAGADAVEVSVPRSEI